jgi:hypothetical protein
MIWREKCIENAPRNILDHLLSLPLKTLRASATMTNDERRMKAHDGTPRRRRASLDVPCGDLTNALDWTGLDWTGLDWTGLSRDFGCIIPYPE